MENENPTILNASDLPSRRRPKSKLSSSPSISTGLFPSATPAAAYTADPFTIVDEANINSLHAAADELDDGEDDTVVDEIDEQEIYDLISTISDPEHPLSLGELAVVNLPHIKVTDYNPKDGNPTAMSHVLVEITPTITHCSLATVIGLGIRVRLEQALPPRFRLDVRIREGTHSTADQVNKQLNDKERVAAACENESLMAVLRKMLETCK